MTWTILPITDFHSVRASWDGLNERGPNSPALHSDFYQALLGEFRSGADNIAVLGAIDAPEAMAILGHSKFGSWNTYQPAQAPLGAWLNASERPLQEILDSLARSLPGIVAKLGLTQLDPDIYPRPAGSRKLSDLDYIPTARITLTGDFETYWSGRGKNLRHNIKRLRNKLAKENISTKLEVITTYDEVAHAVKAYGQLESSGWKAQGGTAIAGDNAQGRFYTNMLSAYATRGHCRIFRLFFNGELVASDFCIDQGNTIIILKTTYSEHHAGNSPAMLMRHAALPDLFSNPQLHRLEFYGRVMDWHTKWSDEIRTLYHANLVRFPFIS